MGERGKASARGLRGRSASEAGGRCCNPVPYTRSPRHRSHERQEVPRGARAAWFEKEAERQRENRETHGSKAARDDVRTTSRLTGPMTPAERKAKQRAKEREERIANGAGLLEAPLAPIEQRRLCNELKRQLTLHTVAQLRRVEAFLHEEFFAPDVATAA